MYVSARSAASRRSRLRVVGGIRHAPRDGRDHLRVRAPGDLRHERRQVDLDLAVVGGVRIGAQRAPVVERVLPRAPGRRGRAAFEVGERRLVRRDHPRASAGLDRHVADGQALLHRQRADGLARVLEHVPDAAGNADPPDRTEDHVLRGHTRRQLAREVDAHGARPLLLQALRGEHVLDLRGADAERERAERAVGGRVAVAADDRHPGLRHAELGADHVDDPLAPAPGREERDAELLAVPPQRLQLGLRERVASPAPARSGRCDPSSRARGRAGAPASRQPEAVERLGRRHLVDQVQVDVEERRLARGLGDDVALPDAVQQRLGPWTRG